MSIIKKTSSTELIIDYILNKIRSKELRPGDQLMNERAFSEELGVSRMPLREAISALSLLGILDAQQGAGTYIKSYDPETLGRIMNIYSVLDDISLEELFEVRTILESQAVRLSIQRMTPEDERRVETALQEGYDFLARCRASNRSEENSLQKFIRLNQFHKALTAGSHNKYLQQFMDSIRTMSADYVIRSSSDPLYEFDVALREHSEIFQAVKAKDGDTACRLLQTHLMKEADALRNFQ